MAQSKKKGEFLKKLGKLIAIALPFLIAAAKSDQIRGSGGAILKEMEKKEPKIEHY